MTKSADVTVFDMHSDAPTDHQGSSRALRSVIDPHRTVITVHEDGSVALTSRELDILRLIADGYDNTQISHQLHFGIGTIKLHVRNILGKLKARSRTQAAVKAVRMGII